MSINEKSCTTNQNILISHISLVDLKKLSLSILKVVETLLLCFTLANLKKIDRHSSSLLHINL